MMPAALEALLTRYSLGPKHLAEPGPDAGQLQWMISAALRGPDHAELVPWRLVGVQGQARGQLAELFAAHALAKGKGEQGAQLERERALHAPLTVAVIARIDIGHPVVPAHEQWMCVGGAVTNFLNAAHALGFAAKILSGDKVRTPAIVQAFCGTGESLVGWIAVGTPLRALGTRQPKQLAQVYHEWKGQGT